MNWTCPHCHRPQVVTSNNRSVDRHHISIGYEAGALTGLLTEAIACLNPDCRKMTLWAGLHSRDNTNPISYFNPPLQKWTLLPDSFAKPQPNYIKNVLREDYFEACKVRDLSPKASATLKPLLAAALIRNGVPRGAVGRVSDDGDADRAAD